MAKIERMITALGITGTVLAYIWLFEGIVDRRWVYAAGAVVVALAAWHDRRTGEWGFDRRALAGGSRVAALWTVGAVAGIFAAGAVTGTIHDRRDFLGSFLALVAWGGAQQWVLQTAVLRDCQRAAGQTAGIGLAALLFGLVHMPNVFLASMTTIGALLWCAIYDRYPNVIPLAVSHALATLAILYAFDEAITGRLRIGASYLRLASGEPGP